MNILQLKQRAEGGRRRAEGGNSSNYLIEFMSFTRVEDGRLKAEGRRLKAEGNSTYCLKPLAQIWFRTDGGRLWVILIGHLLSNNYLCSDDNVLIF